MEKNEILEKLKAALIDEFGLDEGKVVPEALLYEDLGLDSIDAVDLIVKLKSMLPHNIDPEVFKSVRTLQDVVDAIYNLIQEANRN
ncbi:MAG: acyl carrier protein [Fibrobacter sp.]|nr:acyl carrier protein [Fibrobacter sp.]